MTPERLPIIDLFKSGTIVSYATLMAEIKRKIGLKNNSVKFFISKLLDHKIIEMGAVIQCKVCEQRGFFLPYQINEMVTCPICRNQYSLPMDQPSKIEWSYRGVGPFSRNNKADGVMAVFATLGLFHEEFGDISGNVSALIGFNLTKKGEEDTAYLKEIDLGLVIQNKYDTNKQVDLLFCECKTNKRFVEDDMDRLRIIGEEFPGAILVLATLNENLNDQEVVIISKLVQHFQRGHLPRPRNPLLILTGKELLPKGYLDAFQGYDDDIRPYHRYNDFIGALCEFSIKRHLNIKNWWELREEARIEEFKRRRQIAEIVVSLQKRFNQRAE